MCGECGRCCGGLVVVVGGIVCVVCWVGNVVELCRYVGVCDVVKW